MDKMYSSLVLISLSVTITHSSQQWLACLNASLLQLPAGRRMVSDLQSCISHCRHSHYTYALIQHNTVCSCSDWLDAFSEAPPTCCQATPTTCQSELSVHSVSPWGTYGMGCQLACPGNCYNHTLTPTVSHNHTQTPTVCDITTGTCPQGCDREWSGDMCTQRSHCDVIGDLTNLTHTNLSHTLNSTGMSDRMTQASVSAGLYIFPGLSVSQNAYVADITYHMDVDSMGVSFWEVSPPISEAVTNYTATLVTQLQDSPSSDLHLPFVHTGSMLGLYFLQSTHFNLTASGPVLYANLADLPETWHQGFNISVDLISSTPSPDSVENFPFSLAFTCEDACPVGRYGDCCQSLCPGCSSNVTCHPVTGECPETSVTSTVTMETTSAASISSDTSLPSTIGLAVGLVVAVVTLVVTVILCVRCDKNSLKKREELNRMLRLGGSVPTGGHKEGRLFQKRANRQMGTQKSQQKARKGSSSC